jgi:hypothetical protein
MRVTPARSLLLPKFLSALIAGWGPKLAYSGYGCTHLLGRALGLLGQLALPWSRGCTCTVYLTWRNVWVCVPSRRRFSSDWRSTDQLNDWLCSGDAQSSRTESFYAMFAACEWYAAGSPDKVDVIEPPTAAVLWLRGLCGSHASITVWETRLVVQRGLEP